MSPIDQLLDQYGLVGAQRLPDGMVDDFFYDDEQVAQILAQQASLNGDDA